MIDWNDVKTWQIVVVDDEPDNLEVVAETLEFRGATVKTAANGKEALEVLEDFVPNLILTDLSMPVMNGWEMRARIKNELKTRDIPVVALSAHAIAGDKERALDAGFDGYMTKPVNIHTLLDDIRQAAIEKSTAAPAAEAKPAEGGETAPAPVATETTSPAASTAPVETAAPPAAAVSTGTASTAPAAEVKLGVSSETITEAAPSASTTDEKKETV